MVMRRFQLEMKGPNLPPTHTLQTLTPTTVPSPSTVHKMNIDYIHQKTKITSFQKKWNKIKITF